MLIVGAIVVPVWTYPAGAPPIVTVGVNVGVTAAALAADALALAVPVDEPETFGTVTLGTDGIDGTETEPLETLGAAKVGFEIVEILGKRGTAL